MSFLTRHNHTNIILVKIPPRYDTVNDIHVNNDIKTFINKLVKCVKSFAYVRLLEVDQSRQFFTKHGLHLNGIGKELLSKQIVSLMYSILTAKAHPPIMLDWHEEQCSSVLSPQSKSAKEITHN
jgi:hypothetical protein